ncbi:MAG TPA: OsmC family protein [Thermodesulfobacteriota bacterium]|nr:OsmC family protein [Thermodesulfobacteriota bacterium]
MGETTKEKLNGIDTEALKQVMGQISKDPAVGKLRFQVTTTWKGTTKSETVVQGYEIGGQKVKRIHTFVVDEPTELLGEDTAANPQEYLMGAMNACIVNTYVIAAAMKGIRLEKVEMETEGELDLRGFLGMDKNIIPGYKELKYKVRLKGTGTREQYEEVHMAVVATSPNYYNITHAIKLNTELVLE